MKSYQVIIGSLTARTAVHVGMGQDHNVADSICRRDINGNPVIPGTALSGALRSVATRLAPRFGSDPCQALLSESDRRASADRACSCWTCHLFGDINPQEQNNEKKGGRSSRLVFSHASAVLPKGATPRVRDGVGIDRTTKSADRTGSVKFSLEALPAGTQFQLRVELADDLTDDDEFLLAAALAEWQAGRLWLGGRVARGLGAFNVSSLERRALDFEDAECLLTYLKSDEPWTVAKPVPDAIGAPLQDGPKIRPLEASIQTASERQGDPLLAGSIAQSFVALNFQLAIDAQFSTNDPVAALRSGFDHAPLLDVIGRDGRPILPGSSLRGVLRSHAETIARTIVTSKSVNEAEFLASCPACHPSQSNATEALANCDSLLRESGQLGNDDEPDPSDLCLACRMFGSTRAGSRLLVEDSSAIGRPGKKVMDFVGIDRFTGGGKDQAKFDAFTVWQPTFNVKLHLVNAADWELGWLMLVLRDLSDGLLTVGYGAAKGFGRATTSPIQIAVGSLDEHDRSVALGPNKLAAAGNSGVYQSTAGQVLPPAGEDWSAIGEHCVQAFHQQLEVGDRSTQFKVDSYFGSGLQELYPVAQA